MLEPPDLPEYQIVTHLQQQYGLAHGTVTFLPLGADLNTAVYAIQAADQRYFLKLRRGTFEPASVLLPWQLAHQAITPVIAPLVSLQGDLWQALESYTAVLYPFVDGLNGYEQALTAQQWPVFGAGLRGLHDAVLPDDLRIRIPTEAYKPDWRAQVRYYQALAEQGPFVDQYAQQLAQLMQRERPRISALVEQAERLAARLQHQQHELVVCHADIHPGNLLLAADGSLYIIDWDTLTLAPRERDLMFIGSSSYWSDPKTEALFYQGYGEYTVQRPIIAYYRAERVVQDIAAYCEQLLLSSTGGADRPVSLGQIMSQFSPGAEVDLALGRG